MNNFKKITTASCFLVMGLSLGSCELLGPKPVAKLPLTPVTKEQPDVVFKELQYKPPVTDTVKPATELFPGTDRFVPGSAPQNRRTSPKGTGSYSLNFDEADLGEVAKVILSDILGQNYVLSPKVAGKVTLQTTEPLTKEELLPTLEMVLRMNNAALVKDGRIYHIEPAAEALYTSNISSSKSGYQTRVIPVRNVAVQDIAEIIKPLVHDKTILNVDGARNILVASGTADEIARVIDLVDTFDIDVLKGRSFGLFPLAHVDPETMIDELEGIFYKGKTEESEFFQFIPIERLNAVLAVTHQSRYLAEIESWVSRLDRASTASGGGVNVYKVQHMDAGELADTLNEIFTGAAKKDKSAKLAPGKKASTMTNKQPTGTGTQPTIPTGNLASFSLNQPDENSSADNAQSGNPGAFALNQPDENSLAGNAASGNPGAFALNRNVQKSSASNQPTGEAHVANVDEVRIIADVANNAVVIVATPRAYETILPVIKQLDILPLQVLIDATVVSVKLTDNLQYGIEWFLRQGDTAIGSNLGTEGALSGIDLENMAITGAKAFGTGGLSLVQNSNEVKAVLHAEANKGNVDVISSPSLMVLNNQEAKINVGQQVPISTGSTSTPIAGGVGGATLAQSNTIQYMDTGVTLEVTPRVNANGMVIMDIKQIVSNVVSVPSDASATQQSSPTIDKKEIESSVAVLDGETIALGGLIDEQNTENKNGIPWLYQLPLIGPLFGSTTFNTTKNELVVLITPRVVKSKQDSRVVTNEFKRKLTGIYQDVSETDYETSMGR